MEASLPEKHFLIHKTKTIKIDSSGQLLINGRKYEPRDEQNNIISFDAKTEAIKQTRDFYKKLLLPQVENLIVLSGAGTSVGIGAADKVGKTMAELWKIVDTEKTSELSKLCQAIQFENIGDLEKLLSKANRAKDFVNVPIESTIQMIERVVKDNCTLTLPENSPHEIFLNRVTARKTKYPRVRLFTLNYDTLFEQAAEMGGFAVIDGFSFTSTRFFRGTFFDLDFVFRENSRVKNEENFSPKVFHLYKLHGSVDWSKEEKRIIQKKNCDDPFMIYPRDTKYEHAFEQPFFEMMARFQQSLRQQNVQLISIGFSLTDKHIMTSIRETVSQNSSAQIIIVNRTIRTDDDWKWFIEKAKVDSRITLIAEEFKDFATNYPEDMTITREELLRETYDE
jgi:NAD-dependent SIR2 family protein deacetylase